MEKGERTVRVADLIARLVVLQKDHGNLPVYVDAQAAHWPLGIRGLGGVAWDDMQGCACLVIEADYVQESA